MDNKKVTRPSWEKSDRPTSADSENNDQYLKEEEDSAAIQNQELVKEFKKLLPEARNRGVSYTIARLVGERITLSTSASSINDWRMIASALGFDVNELNIADYWGRIEQEYPLTKLLLEWQGNLAVLMEILISKELYAIMEEIKPQILKCIQNPHYDSNESPSESRQLKNPRGGITINISDRLTVSVSSNGTPVGSLNDSTSSQSQTTVNTESSNSTTSASSNLTDDNCKEGIVQLGNGKSFVGLPQKEDLHFQTFGCSVGSNAMPACSPSFPYQNSPESLATKNSSNLFNSNISETTASPNSYMPSVYGASPNVLSLEEIFTSLSLTDSTTSSVPSSPCTTAVGNLPNPVPTPNGTVSVRMPDIYVFITHTDVDNNLANTVARKLKEDFKIIGVTQRQLLHWFSVNHEDTISKILKEVHFVMPLVTMDYLNEIGPDNREECSHQQLSVRNIFTALQTDFFNHSSLNWKIRPVVAEGTSMFQTREKQELRVAMRLWQDWKLVGLMLQPPLQYWHSRSG